MGLDYSIELFFRVEDLERALLETAKIAHVYPDHSIQVTLPNERVIQLPFTSQFKTDPIDMRPDQYVRLDTSLLFPATPDMQAYDSDRDLVEVEGSDYFPMGYIYLSVRVGKRYAEFSFMAATSDMSRHFLNSKTVHERFFELLVAANGVLALIDIEDGPRRLLSDPRRSVALRYKEIPPGHPDKALIRLDRFVEAALRVKANLK